MQEKSVGEGRVCGRHHSGFAQVVAGTYKALVALIRLCRGGCGAEWLQMRWRGHWDRPYEAV